MNIIDTLKEWLRPFTPEPTWESLAKNLDKPLPDDVLTRAVSGIASATVLYPESLRIEIVKHAHHPANMAISVFDTSNHSFKQWLYLEGARHESTVLLCHNPDTATLSMEHVANAIAQGKTTPTPVQEVALRRSIIDALDHHFEQYYGENCTFRVHTIRKGKNNRYVTVPMSVADQSTNSDRAHQYNLEKSAVNWILAWGLNYIPDYVRHATIKDHLFNESTPTLDDTYDAWKVQWKDWYTMHKNMQSVTPLDIENIPLENL